MGLFGEDVCLFGWCFSAKEGPTVCSGLMGCCFFKIRQGSFANVWESSAEIQASFANVWESLAEIQASSAGIFPQKKGRLSDCRSGLSVRAT